MREARDAPVTVSAGGDGPWRVSAGFNVTVLAGLGEGGGEAAAALGTALADGGLPVAEVQTTPPGALAAVFAATRASGVDVLVVDVRTTLEAGMVAELRRVADGDPMIAAVMPRFSADAAGLPPGATPEVAYALLPDRRCLYLKASALAEATTDHLSRGVGITPPPRRADASGGTDLHPFPKEIETLLALNRLGFRVAVAGRAQALHPDVTPSAAVPSDWRPALDRWRAAAPSLADALMDGLRPGPDGRRTIAFDLSHVGPSHSGTTGLARALLRCAASRWADVALHVVATPETFAFHVGDLGGRVARSDPGGTDVFAALIRIGQPFLWRDIDAAVRRAPVLVLFMLDTIGLDCQHDAPDELDALWRFCLAEADGLLFNSAFTERQFARRFAMRPGLPAMPSLHSLDLADYRSAATAAESGDGILVVGNAMPHKRLGETTRLLAAAGLSRPLTVLGLAPGTVPGVEAVPSGAVTPERMAALYAAARVVVYPSVYEGFGFPILEALAHRRPILVRPLPPYDEIAAGLPEAANIHRYAGDADLLRRLGDPPAWTEARRDDVRPRNWGDAADDLRAVLDAALAGVDHGRVTRRIDALRGRMRYMRALALGGADDDLDRLAGMAGRLAQDAVLRLGRLPGGRALLDAARRAAGRR